MNEIFEFFDNAYAKYHRYWQKDIYYSVSPADYRKSQWQQVLTLLNEKRERRILDIGAGEGTDAIRLAKKGHIVDAVEGSEIGADKIALFARNQSVRVNVINENFLHFQLNKTYDFVNCSGVLHYIPEELKEFFIGKLQRATVPGGVNMVHVFSNWSPVPNCHKFLPVFPENEENGLLRQMYSQWQVIDCRVERLKADLSHSDLPPHRHSFVKLLVRKPLE